MCPPCRCTRIFFPSLMHPIGPELPISAHVACVRVCRQLYVLRASHALVQATVGVGTVIIVYIGVAYTMGGVVSQTKFLSAEQSRTVVDGFGQSRKKNSTVRWKHGRVEQNRWIPLMGCSYETYSVIVGRAAAHCCICVPGRACVERFVTCSRPHPPHEEPPARSLHAREHTQPLLRREPLVIQDRCLILHHGSSLVKGCGELPPRL